MARHVYAYDFNKEAGTVSNRRVAIDYATDDALGVHNLVHRHQHTYIIIVQYPDGMSIDENDNLWIASWAGARVTCWDPRTATVLHTIAFPTGQFVPCLCAAAATHVP